MHIAQTIVAIIPQVSAIIPKIIPTFPALLLFAEIAPKIIAKTPRIEPTHPRLNAPPIVLLSNERIPATNANAPIRTPFFYNLHTF